MLFKTRKARLFFYLSILAIVLLFILLRDSDYVPQAYSLHMISEARRGDRLIVFEENPDVVAALWERVNYRIDRPEPEPEPADEDYFFTIFFSEGQDVLSRRGQIIVRPDQLIVDGQEKKIKAEKLFSFCQEIMQSRRGLISLVVDAEYVELIDPETGQGRVLEPPELDKIGEALLGIENGEPGKEPSLEKTKLIFSIPEGQLFLQKDQRLIFEFWGGYWHYQGTDELENLEQTLQTRN